MSTTTARRLHVLESLSLKDLVDAIGRWEAQLVDLGTGCPDAPLPGATAEETAALVRRLLITTRDELRAREGVEPGGVAP